MINKHDILNMVRAVYRHDRGLPPRRLIYPAREWGIGVVVTAVLLLGTCVMAGVTYLSLNSLEEWIETPVVETVQYDTAAADRVRELYATRAARYNELVAGTAPPLIPATVASSSVASSTDSAINESASTTTSEVLEAAVEINATAGPASLISS